MGIKNKCTKELERYLLTMDRSAILSHVYSPYTHSLHGAQLYTVFFRIRFKLLPIRTKWLRLGGGGGMCTIGRSSNTAASTTYVSYIHYIDSVADRYTLCASA